MRKSNNTNQPTLTVDLFHWDQSFEAIDRVSSKTISTVTQHLN